jgi:esterase/lipase superfamily enzyme
MTDKNIAESLDQMPDDPVEVFFITNRENLGSEARPKFGKGFHPKGHSYLRFGAAEVEAPKDWGSDKFTVKKVSLAREKIPKSSKGKTLLGSSQVFESLRQLMSEKESDTLIYLHGFANSFESAIQRAAEIKIRYQWKKGCPLNVVAFCWPSDGEMIPFLSYYRDRDDARVSAQAMARSFLRLRDWLQELEKESKDKGGRKLCRQKLHLVAHSMGNYALRHAVQGIARELNGNLERVFDNVFLMAADEDDDTFEKDYKLGILPDLARAVHVYYSESDVPLDELSDITKLQPDRLGTQGPRNKDGLHRKVALIDCTDVDFTKLKHGWHQYYRFRPEVYEDVRAVLAGALPRAIVGRQFMPDERAYRILPFANRKSSSPD